MSLANGVGNVEAERSLLGSILMSQEAANYIIGSLPLSCISDVDDRNKVIYKAMVELYDAHKPVDVQAVVDILIFTKTFDDAGGIKYLNELIEYRVSKDSIDHYLNLVKDQAILRDYLIALEDIQKDFRDGTYTDIGNFLAASTDRLRDIVNKRQVGEFKDSATVAELVRHQLEEEGKYANRFLTGVDTGYKKLNKLTHGWQKGNLIILAARPSVGKTSLAVNFAYNAVAYAKGTRSVAFFSGEMDNAQIMKKMLSFVGNVEYDHLTTGDLTEREKSSIDSAIASIKDRKIYFDDTPNPVISDIVSKAMKLKAADPDLSLIIIDYLNIIETAEKYDSKNMQVGKITSSLKQLARELEIPVICLCQINRKSEDNSSGRPSLSNLKDSGKIEEDADIVMLLSRGDYNKSGKQKKDPQPGSYLDTLTAQVNESKKNNGDKASMSISNIEVAKNRNGPTGDVTLLFSKSFSRFDNPSPEMEKKVAEASGNDYFDEEDE